MFATYPRALDTTVCHAAKRQVCRDRCRQTENIDMRGIRRRPHHAALCMTKLQKRGRYNITTISVLHSCCIKHATIMTTKTARNNYDEFYFCTFNVLNDSVLHINCTFYRTLLQYFYSFIQG